MNDHFRGVRNMISDTPRTQARVRYMIDNNISPEGLEHWANGLECELNAANAEIERLTAKVAQLYEGAEEAKQRIHSLIAERDTARQQSDQKVSLREEFRELLGTDDIEQGITVVCDLKQLAAVRLGYIKQLEEQLMDTKNKHAVLVADVVLNEDRAERIKRLEKDSERLAWLLKTGLAWRGCYDDWWKTGEWLYASQSTLAAIDKAKEDKL